MSTSSFNGPKDFRLIPQEKTFVYEFNNELDHNSTWDTTMGPDGKLYMSLSSELNNMGFARLYEYDYKTNKSRKLIDVEELLIPHYRALRPSKFHTSISFMNDGNLAMTTHSTDKGTAHPTWMPFSYFGHMWEGFSGSTIITYNFESGKAEILGVPAPGESLYTSCYDKKHNAFYSMGYLKGHLYRFDFDKRQVKDLGKVTENASFKICPGPDGNLYSSSKSGWVFRINTDTEQIEDMNYRVPMTEHRNGNISCGRIGPDGKLYMTTMRGPNYIAIDTATGEIKDMGPYLNTDKFAFNETGNGVFGMDFDEKGRLWYVVDTSVDAKVPGNPCGLYCWDITKKGSRPQYKGIIGIPGRISICVSEMHIHDNNALIVDQNHGLAATAVFVVNLDQFDKEGDITVLIDPEKQSDNMFHAGDPEQTGYNDPFTKNELIKRQNPSTFDGDLVEYYRVWRELAPDHISDSSVKGLVWDEDGTLYGLCGIDYKFIFIIKDNEIEVLPEDKVDENLLKWLYKALNNKVTTNLMCLPAYPGRQYKAVSVVEAELTGERKLVGTEDGLLAIVDGDNVYSLGMCGYNGPVRDMSSTPDKRTVYGTAGDDEDLGMVFKYTDEQGLELKGNINSFSGKQDGILASNILSSCQISKDGKKLAIASAERLGTVYIYNIF